MDSNFPVKIVIIQSPEGRMMSGRKGFHSANALNQLVACNTLTHQQEDGMCGLKGKASCEGSMDERKLFTNRREYTCPSIIDFNTMKPNQELRPIHKPRRIFNGFFPSRVRAPAAPVPHAVGNNFRPTDKRDRILEDLAPDPPRMSSHQNGGAHLKRVVLSRNSHRSEPSVSSQRSEPNLPGTSEKQEPKTAVSRTVVCSLRNGSHSPWIDRYKLKQKSITASQTAELKIKTLPVEARVRGFSR